MPRKTAFDVLMRIEKDDAFSHIVLGEALDRSGLDGRDKGLATALVYGTLTWRRALDNLINRHLSRGSVSQLDAPVRTVLRLGTYQLKFLDRVPDHASVDASVELCKEVGKARAAGLVNAVLRALTEDDKPWWRDADLERKRARWLADKWSLPTWLANRLWQQFGDEAEDLAEAFSKAPPVYLRRPAGAPEPGEGVTPVEGVPQAWVGAAASDWRDEVLDGSWVVQDLGSQLVGWYAGVNPTQRVLDACAGLGGKTLQLAERGASVTAVDPNGSKIRLLREALSNNDLDVTTQVATLEDFADGYGGDPFDLVLVDAPCSGLGVLRRHAETRWSREESAIPRLAKIQARLLERAAKLVADDGTLVYAVCTFTREETTRQVERFLASHPDWERAAPPDLDFDITPWLGEEHALRTLPHTHDTDGFYAVRLRRRSDS